MTGSSGVESIIRMVRLTISTSPQRKTNSLPYGCLIVDKLFDFYYDYDFGHDLYLTIGQFKNFNLLDTEIHTSEYWSWEPNIRLTFGVFTGKVFSLDLSLWSLSLSLDFISYRYPFNLSHTRQL